MGDDSTIGATIERYYRLGRDVRDVDHLAHLVGEHQEMEPVGELDQSLPPVLWHYQARRRQPLFHGGIIAAVRLSDSGFAKMAFGYTVR